ncbi:MAG: alpha/beta hydrolase-fold protein [Pseudobdellovibrionaceae bacterium]
MRAVLFVALVFSFNVFAQVDCGQETRRGTTYSWCITEGESNDVLYYMHGGGGSEKSWADREYAGFLKERWQKIGFKTPHVIVVSFGKNWLLTDMKTTEHAAMLTMFVEEIMPSLEARLPGRSGRRILMGNSMGGYNGSVLALRYPQLWERVAILCFGPYTVDAFESDAKIEDYIKTLPAAAKPDYVRGLVRWVREEFETKDNWERHNPLTLAAEIKSLKPTFHLSCTKDDQYGFYEGAQQLAEVIGKITAVSFSSMDSGGHCALNDEAEQDLAEFLAGK